MGASKIQLVDSRFLNKISPKEYEFTDVSQSDTESVFEKEILSFVPLVSIEGSFNEENKLVKANVKVSSNIIMETSSVLIVSPHNKKYISNIIKSYRKDWEVVTLDNLAIFYWSDIPLVLITYSGFGIIEDLVIGDY